VTGADERCLVPEGEPALARTLCPLIRGAAACSPELGAWEAEAAQKGDGAGVSLMHAATFVLLVACVGSCGRTERLLGLFQPRLDRSL